jgi:hypothetical protein
MRAAQAIHSWHVYGGRAWETLGSAGVLSGRFANLRTAAPILFGDSGDGSNRKELNHGTTYSFPF